MPGSAAARASISGSVSSLMAATTTSTPCARAASSSRNGNRPLPAIKPSLVLDAGVTLLLLDDTALGTLDKGHQVRHGALQFAFAPQALQRLRGIQFGCQQDAIRVLQGLQLRRGEAGTLQADAVEAIGMGLAPGRSQGEGQDVLGDGGAAAHVGMLPDTAKLMHRAERADAGVVLYGDVAGQGGAVGQDAVVADGAVVTDVGVSHDQ